MSRQSDLTSVIRRKCVYCCGGSIREAARCTSEECPLWAYRPKAPQRPKRGKGVVQITMRMYLETRD